MTKAILQNGITQADYARVVWRLTPEAGTTPEDILVPAYYAHVAKQLKPGAKIEVTPVDGSWYAELYVRSSDAISAKVALLELYTFDEVAQVEAAAFEIKHRGPKGWSVVRTSDKAVVFENGKAKDEASQWIADQSLA